MPRRRLYVTVTVGSGPPALSSAALTSAYMAYYGAMTALSSSVPSQDPATGSICQRGRRIGDRAVRNESRLPMLMAGGIFYDYNDAASGYTINGNLSYVFMMNSSNETCLYRRWSNTPQLAAVYCPRFAGYSIPHTINYLADAMITLAEREGILNLTGLGAGGKAVSSWGEDPTCRFKLAAIERQSAGAVVSAHRG